MRKFLVLVSLKIYEIPKKKGLVKNFTARIVYPGFDENLDGTIVCGVRLIS